MSHPDAEDYLALFKLYGDDLGALYREPDDERYALLFEQVARLLLKPSRFNLSLPPQFRISAERYLAGDPVTVKHLSYPANRHFMISDLYDLIKLRHAMAQRRGETG